MAYRMARQRFSAAHFRARAKELRALSKVVEDEEMRKTLLQAAHDYDRMAEAREPANAAKR